MRPADKTGWEARGQCRAVGTNLCQVDAGLAAALDTPLAAAWETIRTGLRRDCGARTFDGWLKPAELGDFDADSGELELVMPSQFMADWVRSHFGERLALAWKTVLPIVRDVRIAAADGAPRPSPLLILEEIPAPRRGRRRAIPTRPISTRATASRRSSSARPTKSPRPPPRPSPAPTAVSFNPLFIHGGTGRGKTHLLHAIGQDFLARRPGGAGGVDVGREVHGRVRPRAEGE